MPKALDITNQRFGKLVAVSKAASKSGKTYWLCKCDCGNEKEIQTSHLIDGRTKSCGNCGFINDENKVKKCEICGKEFNVKPGGVSRKYCFECSPSYQKGGSKSKTISAIRKAMKQEAVKRFGGKCSICGYNKSIWALQFHHNDPSEKEFSLSSEGGSCSWESFWEEAQKCILVCSNCHAELHEQLNKKS